MSKRSPELLVNDILESANKILHYCSGLTYKQFISDEKTIDAVIRNFEIIGEAANRLPLNFKETHPSIDWQRVRGFRNRIVHEYFGTDPKIVWLIKEEFLPELIAQLKNPQIK